MKEHLLKLSLFIPIILVFLVTCVYHKITHLNKDDLEWVRNRSVGETMIFESFDGDMDTVVVNSIEIFNSLNPISINWNTGGEYIAIAYVKCDFFHEGDSLKCCFFVEKIVNDEPAYLNARLDKRFSYTIKQNFSTMYIDSHLIKDAICFDDTNSELSIHNEQENPVKSFIWSKRYGLVQYSFKDGKIYNRKITEKDLVENY